MNSTHTPGPWTLGDKIIPHTGECGRLMGGCRHVFGPNQPDGAQNLIGTITQDANARLIAAAPDLLEACRGMLRHLEREGLQFDAMDDARAAIAKATGKGE